MLAFSLGTDFARIGLGKISKEVIQNVTSPGQTIQSEPLTRFIRASNKSSQH